MPSARCPRTSIEVRLCDCSKRSGAAIARNGRGSRPLETGCSRQPRLRPVECRRRTLGTSSSAVDHCTARSLPARRLGGTSSASRRVNGRPRRNKQRTADPIVSSNALSGRSVNSTPKLKITMAGRYGAVKRRGRRPFLPSIERFNWLLGNRAVVRPARKDRVGLATGA